MRILQLVNSLDVGGLEQVVVDLCNNLGKHNIKCHIFCLSHMGEKAISAKPISIDVGGLTELSRFPKLEVLAKLINTIKINKIDLIHSHNPKSHLYGVIASLVTRVPHINTIHGRGPISESGRRKLLRRILSFFTDCVVAVSEDVNNKLITEDHINNKKVLTVINGVDTAKYVPLQNTNDRNVIRDELNIPENAFVIGSVGRFAKEKNYVLLVNAFAMFNKIKPDSYLVIVGDGEEMSNIKEAVSKNSLQGKCILPGMRSDISAWMKVFDLFALSSDTEGTPITILEAMATGLAIVATNVGGNKSVIDPPCCGLIVEPHEPLSFCNALLELSLHNVELQKMSITARRRIELEFSIDSMVEKYIDLYKRFTRKVSMRVN